MIYDIYFDRNVDRSLSAGRTYAYEVFGESIERHGDCFEGKVRDACGFGFDYADAFSAWWEMQRCFCWERSGTVVAASSARACACNVEQQRAVALG